MATLPAVIPVTDLRQDAAGVLKRVAASENPIIVTQRGRSAAVLMSTAAYERAEHEREILRLLAQGEKEIAAGKGHDMDAVLREADQILAKTQR